MPNLEFKKYSLHYLQKSGDKPTLIFLHGLGGNGMVWKYQIEHFQDKYQILAPDFLGHGQSSKDVPTESIVPLQIEIIQNLIDTRVTGQYILIGHSFAGNIIPELIRKNDANLIGVAFIDCIYQNQFQVIEMREKFAEMMLAIDDDALNSETTRWYLELTSGRADENDTRFILSSLEDCNPRHLFETVRSSCRYNRQNMHNTTPLNENMKVLIAEADKGDIGRFVNKSWINHFKDSRYYLFENSNHFLFVTDRDKFNELLDEFIKSCLEQ